MSHRNDEIRDFFDSHLSMNLKDIASRFGISVPELKKILMEWPES